MSTITHLKELESESIYVLREVAAQFERPVILFSGGKDSIVIVHLAYKAFYPAKIPFPLLHIDTGHNFQETIAYRDALATKLGAELIVGSVQESIDTGRVKEETGYYASRNRLQTTTLLDTISCNFNVLIAGMPRVMGVRELLDEWCAWRTESVKRRVYYVLAKRKDKLHLLKGLKRILLDIDKAIQIIRETEAEADVVPNLMIGFGIDKVQAEYVAEIKLRNINKE